MNRSDLGWKKTDKQMSFWLEQIVECKQGTEKLLD